MPNEFSTRLALVTDAREEYLKLDAEFRKLLSKAQKLSKTMELLEDRGGWSSNVRVFCMRKRHKGLFKKLDALKPLWDFHMLRYYTAVKDF